MSTIAAIGIAGIEKRYLLKVEGLYEKTIEDMRQDKATHKATSKSVLMTEGLSKIYLQEIAVSMADIPSQTATSKIHNRVINIL